MKKKKLIVTGDRVLLKPDLDEERTKVGLYLPQTVKSKEEVIGGFVIQTGPGIPLAEPSDLADEPWKKKTQEMKYLPVQAKPGDYALFLQKAGVEIKYEGENYIIIPQSAILLIIREEEENFSFETSENDELPL
ncbi:chaperonin [candidate division KSB1 bacterium 4484_188]|nr:MAG: chaperonin [candidate division KSB1 bacterium 4484_188]HFE64732.1 co-chaperone GroES [Caldithrix sp.]